MINWVRSVVGRRARVQRKRKHARGAYKPPRRGQFETLERRALLSGGPFGGGVFVAGATAADPAKQILVAGADAGGGPHVRVYAPQLGAEIMNFFAFNQNFRGGVRVATGDITGDGIADIVAAAGPGGGPNVRVFNGVSGALERDFMAYDLAFAGGVYVATGDVNGDGRDDVVTGAGVGGAAHVKVFSGLDGSQLGNFFAFDPAFRGGVTVGTADIDNDGRAEIIAGAGPGGGPHVRVFDDALGNQVGGAIGNFFAFSQNFTGGVFVAGGDLNNDGRDDVIVGAGPGGGPHVTAFDAMSGAMVRSFFAFGPTFTGGVRVAAPDYANDGVADILAAAGPGGGPSVRVFDGLTQSIQVLPSGLGNFFPFPGGQLIGGLPPQLSPAEVNQLISRAAAASASNDAIIAIVDRGGHILGVRVEAGVPIAPNDLTTLVFAIDGAVAKARTAAFFSSNAAPLTSRTVRFISQTTITQREVQSNPNIGDLNSPFQGPGFVAPIGLGGHFPPDISNTPPVDLFAIEHTNRDSIIHPGADGIKQPGDPVLPSRFNVEKQYIPYGKAIDPPESYGYVSGLLPFAQARGIATLPGGIPIYRDSDNIPGPDTLIGGIGVFFPGSNGFASYEQGFVPGVGQTSVDRTNAARVLESEWIALAAIGGSSQAGARVGALAGIPAIASIDLPFGRIDLVGITLEIIGPHPEGLTTILNVGASVGQGNPNSHLTGFAPIAASGGLAVPDGWLVLPHDSPVGGITKADVEQIIQQGIAEAELVRAAIRLPLGSRTRMVFSVTDTVGNVLGLYRMPDATFFSIHAAVAKARNVASHADPAQLQPADMVDDNRDGIPDVAPGVAFTNRTFRFLAEPRFPSGVDGSVPGAFSMLRDPGINPQTAENLGAPLPAIVYASNQSSVMAFDSFVVGRNFRDPVDITNQNGIVFFPGSVPVYKNGALIGGFGVSGDGVDQDDVVTAFGARGYGVPLNIARADEVFVRGVRLPYQKFNRNPEAQ